MAGPAWRATLVSDSCTIRYAGLVDLGGQLPAAGRSTVTCTGTPAARVRSASSSSRASPTRSPSVGARAGRPGSCAVPASRRRLASWIASSAGRRLLAVLAGQVHGDPGLHLDHRDAVGQRVVQLPGDAQALLPGAAQRHLLAGAFGLDPPAARPVPGTPDAAGRRARRRWPPQTSPAAGRSARRSAGRAGRRARPRCRGPGSRRGRRDWPAAAADRCPRQAAT